MIPQKLWDVLSPDERRYLAALMSDAEGKAMTPADFAALASAMLALFMNDPMHQPPKCKLTLTVTGATDAELAEVRARLTPEQNEHLELVSR